MATLTGGASSSTEGPLEQPLNVFFDLTIGGLSKIYTSPQLPISFTYDCLTNFVTITLFDVTGHVVEAAIVNASQNSESGIAEGTFQFGYQGTTQLMSRTYNFQVQDYIPQFKGNAFIVTIIGIAMPTFNMINSSNAYSGTVEEIFQAIAKNYNCQLVINPPFGDFNMQDVGYVDKDTTAKQPMQHMKLATEADWSYIQRIVKWAKDGQNQGPYKAFVTTDNDGNNVLAVVLAQASSPKYQYTVQEANTHVISWEPNIDFTAGIFGANSIQQKNYTRGNGEEQANLGNQAVTKDQQALLNTDSGASLPWYFPTYPTPTPPAPNGVPYYFNSTLMPPSVTGATTRTKPAASSSPYGGNNPFYNQHLAAWRATQSATLTILGDPGIDPYDPDNQNTQTVDMTVYYPKGYFPPSNNTSAQEPHYSSGVWMIDGVRHVITAGSYTTVINLIRPDGPEPDMTIGSE